MTSPHTPGCKWTSVAKVWKAGVKRGGIEFKGIEGVHATTYDTPDEQTVARIRNVLEETAPSVEIWLFVMGIMMPFWVCALIFFGKQIYNKY